MGSKRFPSGQWRETIVVSIGGHAIECLTGPTGADQPEHRHVLLGSGRRVHQRRLVGLLGIRSLPDAKGEKVAEFRQKFANPYIAAGRGFIDEVIHPRETRRKLIAALRNLDNKRDKNPPKKHGNIPL